MTSLFQARSKLGCSAVKALALALASLIFCLASGVLAQEDPRPASTTTTITNFVQFWALSSTAEEREYPTRLQLVINYYDPEWKLIWVGSDSGGAFLRAGNSPPPLKSGQVVELDGVARPGKLEIVWDRTKVKVLESSATNQPVPLPDKIEDPENLNLRVVETEGLVDDQIEIDSNHLRLDLSSAERNIAVYVHLGSEEAIPRFKDAFVRLRGVFLVRRDAISKTAQLEIWVAEASHVKVTSWLSQDSRFARPRTAIETLLASSSNALVRVEGVVRSQEAGQSLTVRDETGQVKLLSRQTQAVTVGDRIEAIGFPATDGPESILRRSLFRPLADAGRESQVRTNLGLPMLRLTEQVRELSPEEAARGYPVRINGVVTWADPEARFFFLQDGSGGVKVMLPDDGSIPIPDSEAGVVATGETRSGDFVPVVDCRTLSAGGKRTLPSPRSITLEQALSGSEYGQWVEMRGYLRSATPEGRLVRLELTTAAGEFVARVSPPGGPQNLQGAIVKIRAVCDAVTNERRQLIGVRLWVPSYEYVEVLEPSPADLFATPRRSIGSLLRFNPINGLNRRAQVSGVVLLHRPGQFFYLQDEDDSLLVLSRQSDPLHPGDRVDVVGFPGHQGWRLVMREAAYRRSGTGPEPVPIPLNLAQSVSNDLDGRLVHVQGVLLNSAPTGDETRLQIQNDQTVFEAQWSGRPGAKELPLRVGSVLGLTGVYRVKLDQHQQPQGFVLNLRSPSDIHVVRRPSYWTAARVLWIAAGLLMIVVITAVWGIVLSRKNQLLNRAQLDLHKANSELEVRIQERQRSEEALRETNRRFEIVTHATTDVIWDRDLGSNALWWNEHFQTVFGYPANEIGAGVESWTSRIHPDDAQRVITGIHSVIDGGGHLWSAEYRFRRRDGSYASILDRAYILHDEKGHSVRIIGAMQDITQRKQSEQKLQETHEQLVEASRQAGMAEVATGVLHNVGNILNSVNVASSCMAESLKRSKAANLLKVVALLREREADLGSFFTSDPKGKQILGYLGQLAEHLTSEQAAALKEFAHLQQNVEHIKEIVSMQQSYATVSGATQVLQMAELVEDALRMNSSALSRGDIQIIKEFEDVPPVPVVKHKLLQILVNLLRNAKQACDEAGRTEKQLIVRVTNGNDSIRISVKDNGIGMTPESLNRIFAHGFTTKKDGHGFGLHSGALAAKEMGGSLSVDSDGVGQGATFTLELPCNSAGMAHLTAAKPNGQLS